MSEQVFILCVVAVVILAGAPLKGVQQRLRWIELKATTQPLYIPASTALTALIFYVWTSAHTALEDRVLSRWVVAARLGSLAAPTLLYAATRAMMELR